MMAGTSLTSMLSTPPGLSSSVWPSRSSTTMQSRLEPRIRSLSPLASRKASAAKCLADASRTILTNPVWRPAGVLQGCRLALAPEAQSAGSLVPALARHAALAGGARHVARRAARRRVFRCEDARDGPARHVGGRPSEDRRGAPAPVGDPALDIGGDDREVDRALDDGSVVPVRRGGTAFDEWRGNAQRSPRGAPRCDDDSPLSATPRERRRAKILGGIGQSPRRAAGVRR